jgi:glycosyltransferase involved in cell wall biosynthesis
MSNTPFFSIVTVSFNSEKTIARTIESILNQSLDNFEYIIIDGKSTDTTLEIIKSFEPLFTQKNIKYSWISEADGGIYDAFNKGVNFAKGKWISFLGSDDYYYTSAIESYYYEIIKIKSELDFIHSNVKVEQRKVISEKWQWKKFRRKMNIAHVGAFHNTNYFKKYGLFNTNYRIAGDYELLLRAKNKLKTHWFNKVTAFMSDGGISNNQVKNVLKETTLVKTQNKSTSKFIAELDYYIWIIKYKVKKIINAIIR